MGPCHWIPDHWLSFVQKAMHTHDVTIQYNSWMILPLCTNDHFLMEDFQDHGTPPNQLEKLNVCRMYLQVTMLAEITDQTGTLLLPQILAGPQNPTPKGLVNISMSLLKWLTIALPTSTCWRLWDKTICTLYMGSPTRMKLQQPLGMWQPTYNQQHFWH